jgi:tRNA 2-thiouridine synthesizing protein A
MTTTVTLDVRGLQPPQPLVRMLEGLDRLADDERLEVRIDRRPMLLYPHVEARGFAHATEDLGADGVRVLITRGTAG